MSSGTVALPGPLLGQMHEAGLLRHESLRNVLAIWRSPERLAKSPRWQHASAGLVDVQAFGEIGLVAARREPFGLPEPLTLGAIKVPRGAEDAALTMETARSSTGSLALRGPMVPRHPFPTGDTPALTTITATRAARTRDSKRRD